MDSRQEVLIALWMYGVHVTDTDAKSYSKRAGSCQSARVAREKEKKQKHLEACLERNHHVTLFVCSVDGMLGQEGKAFVKRLLVADKLVSKCWEKSYS